jgi:2-methylcitrate dehydratase
MVYILSTMLRKAFEDKSFHTKLNNMTNLDEVWKALFLSPFDYGYDALYNKNTRVIQLCLLLL